MTGISGKKSAMSGCLIERETVAVRLCLTALRVYSRLLPEKSKCPCNRNPVGEAAGGHRAGDGVALALAGHQLHADGIGVTSQIDARMLQTSGDQRHSSSAGWPNP